MEIMRRCGGVVCYSAMPSHLKMSALAASRLAPRHWNQGEMDYCEIAHQRTARSWRSDGEIQVFSCYEQMLRDAALARREIEREQGKVSCLEHDRERVQTRALEIKDRRCDALRKTS
ncbi:MAG: hypothetical protein KY445_10530 [Armatimonadetes bacterium]|nr:hypothetical protein [Armatimonadota bacterium]